MNDLQELVDALAAELGRPVGLDDRQFRSLAYSSHFEQVDEVRLASILHREAPKEVTAWLQSLRVQDAEWFTRVPANQGLGMAARVCVPVRWQGLLLGYVWLIDSPQRLGDEEIDASLRCAAEAALMLYRARLLESADRSRERELVGQLLTADAPSREIAARQLIDGGFVERSPVVCVTVLRAEHPELPPVDAVRVRLAAAMERLRRALRPHRLVTFIDSDLIASVIVCQDDAEVRRRGTMVFEKACGALEGSEGWRPIVGVGDARAALADAHGAYREARHASALAASVPTLGPLVTWSSLGAYRTVARLVDSVTPGEAVPGALRLLLASPDAHVLVPTVETYLERGGDAKATAAELFVHRSSLYNRLHRVEEIAGIDLRSGDHRLELHLGLRLWRMSGVPPAQSPPDLP